MKRLALLLTFLLFPAFAQAQEAYTVNATAAQVTRLTKAVTIQNRQTCAASGFVPTCTQAQVCTFVNAAGGHPARRRRLGLPTYASTRTRSRVERSS